MEEAKKRKLDETHNNGCQVNSNSSEQQQQQHEEAAPSSSSSSVEELRLLLDPLAKPQLVDLLAKLGSQYPSIAEEIRSVASADPALRKLFVRGLAWNTTSETLCAAFIIHGEIEEGAVISDKATGKSRGYGFITYKDMESAQKALKAPSKMIDGRLAVCNLACESLSSTSVAPDQAQRKLYIGGLSPDTTSELLLDFFARHGEIEEGSVAYDKDTNKSRGFGFVTYKTVEAAKKSINDPQKILGGRNITVKLADNFKGKVTQTPAPASVVPVPVPLAAGYPPTQTAHSGTGTPVVINYPQHMAPYANAAYPSPHAAVPLYSAPQIPYPQYAIKTQPPTTHAAVPGYTYYMPKQ